MAVRQYFVTESGAQFYRTRMLSAGDVIALNGPSGRLGLAMGYVTTSKPRKPAAPRIASNTAENDDAQGTKAAKAPARKRSPRKKKTAAKS